MNKLSVNHVNSNHAITGGLIGKKLCVVMQIVLLGGWASVGFTQGDILTAGLVESSPLDNTPVYIHNQQPITGSVSRPLIPIDSMPMSEPVHVHEDQGIIAGVAAPEFNPATQQHPACITLREIKHCVPEYKNRQHRHLPDVLRYLCSKQRDEHQWAAAFDEYANLKTHKQALKQKIKNCKAEHKQAKQEAKAELADNE